MRALTPLLVLFSIPALAGPLNDTGATQCYNGTTLTLGACDAANTGDAATHPRQDGRFGRDAQAGANPVQLTKTGGGAAGFDFTKIGNDGRELLATAGMGPNPGDWACTRDNVTGLIWEVKEDGDVLRDKDWTYRWGATTGGAGCGGTLTPCNTDNLIIAVNTDGLCGHTSGWRLPTRRELLSIVHHGVSNPSIDTSYFPNTVSSWYWSSDLYQPDPTGAWYVLFNYGGANAGSHGNNFHVRLVRSGQ
jgi:hypothetical protein